MCPCLGINAGRRASMLDVRSPCSIPPHMRPATPYTTAQATPHTAWHRPDAGSGGAIQPPSAKPSAETERATTQSGKDRAISTIVQAAGRKVALRTAYERGIASLHQSSTNAERSTVGSRILAAFATFVTKLVAARHLLRVQPMLLGALAAYVLASRIKPIHYSMREALRSG